MEFADPAQGGDCAQYRLTTAPMMTRLEAPGGCASHVTPSAGTHLPIFRRSFLSESGRVIWVHLPSDRKIQWKEPADAIIRL
jgi:hypothetical protein